MMNKVRTFLSMDIYTKVLLVEAFFYLGWARLLKGIPFQKIAPSLGEHMGETSYSSVDTNIAVVKRVAHVIHIMSQYTFWESQCLVRAIAAMKMLERRKIESTLYLGTGKDENGSFAAHAWLRSGPYYVTGANGMERYTVVGKFAKNIGDSN